MRIMVFVGKRSALVFSLFFPIINVHHLQILKNNQYFLLGYFNYQ